MWLWPGYSKLGVWDGLWLCSGHQGGGDCEGGATLCCVQHIQQLWPGYSKEGGLGWPVAVLWAPGRWEAKGGSSGTMCNMSSNSGSESQKGVETCVMTSMMCLQGLGGHREVETMGEGCPARFSGSRKQLSIRGAFYSVRAETLRGLWGFP